MSGLLDKYELLWAVSNSDLEYRLQEVPNSRLARMGSGLVVAPAARFALGLGVEMLSPAVH